MANVFVPARLGVPRRPGVSDSPALFGVLTINAARAGISTDFIVVVVVHDRSGEVVFRKKVKGTVEVNLQSGSAITETYTVLGLDPQETLPPAALSLVTPGETVYVDVADSAPASAGGSWMMAG